MRRDPDDIFDYSTTRWGLDQAVRYIDLIADVCGALAEAPHHAQSCPDIRPGYRRRTVEQHVIHFRATDDGIVVVRILYQRMKASRYL